MLTLLAPCHLPHHRTDVTWHFFIDPHGCLKMPKMSHTWKPLMFPRQLVDIILTVVRMTCGIIWACHVAPRVWILPWFDQTLIGYNFCIQTLFEVIFATLESYRRTLHNEAIFEKNWNDQILSIFRSSWTSVSVLELPGPLWAFRMLLLHIFPLKKFWSSKSMNISTT